MINKLITPAAPTIQECKTPRLVDFVQQGVAQSTFYSVLNITGAGKLFRISFITEGAGNNTLYVRITVDGTATTWSPGALGNQAKGLGGYSSGRTMYIDSIQNIKFQTSLAIEVMQSDGASRNIDVAVDYGLF